MKSEDTYRATLAYFRQAREGNRPGKDARWNGHSWVEADTVDDDGYDWAEGEPEGGWMRSYEKARRQS